MTIEECEAALAAQTIGTPSAFWSINYNHFRPTVGMMIVKWQIFYWPDGYNSRCRSGDGKTLQEALEKAFPLVDLTEQQLLEPVGNSM